MFSLERCSVPPLCAVTAGVCWRTMSRGVLVVAMVSVIIAAVRICESGMPGMLGKNSCWQGWLGAIWRSRYTSTGVVIIC